MVNCIPLPVLEAILPMMRSTAHCKQIVIVLGSQLDTQLKDLPIRRADRKLEKVIACLCRFPPSSDIDQTGIIPSSIVDRHMQLRRKPH